MLLDVIYRFFNRSRGEESGFTTVELLGNAALAVLALVAIWSAFRGLGDSIVEMIRSRILSNP